MHCNPATFLCPRDSPGKNTRVGCHVLLQGIFLTQGSNPYLLCLLHWQAGFFTTSATWEAHKRYVCMCAESLQWPYDWASQASLSKGFSRQEYGSGLPCPPLGDLPDPEIEPESPTLAGRLFTTEPPRKQTGDRATGKLLSQPQSPLPRLLCTKSQPPVQGIYPVFWSFPSACKYCPDAGFHHNPHPLIHTLRNSRRLKFIPWVGKIPGEGSGKPLQYSCLGNPTEEPSGLHNPWGHKNHTRLSD